MFADYHFVPSFGFYSMGFLHLLGNLQLTLTSCLRSLVDAGQFANLQGGFKLKGVRIVDNGEPISPGQFKDIESTMGDINKSIMPLPFKGADQTLYQMLQFIDGKGQQFADSTEQVVADSSNYGPVGTTLALLDASTKFFSAVHKRLHKALKTELRIIADINSETLSSDTDYNVEGEEPRIRRSDYHRTVGIIPVSDPNISSSAHRFAKAQTLHQIALQSPKEHNMKEVLRHVYVNMNYDDVDKFLVEDEDELDALDPISDIRMLQEGKPIKAFTGQDHEAHVKVKTAFLQDPKSGGSPAMQLLGEAIKANIQEHMLLQFMEGVDSAEEQGMPVEEAAMMIAKQNQERVRMEMEQAKQEDDKTGQAAMLLAQAEMIGAQTDAKKQDFDERYKGAQLKLEQEKLDNEFLKEVRRASEFDKSKAHEMEKIRTTKGLDAMVASLNKPKS